MQCDAGHCLQCGTPAIVPQDSTHLQNKHHTDIVCSQSSEAEQPQMRRNQMGRYNCSWRLCNLMQITAFFLTILKHERASAVKQTSPNGTPISRAVIRITSATRSALYISTIRAASSLRLSACAALYASPEMCSARGSCRQCYRFNNSGMEMHIDRLPVVHFWQLILSASLAISLLAHFMNYLSIAF
jgi:hypothetical protein